MARSKSAWAAALHDVTKCTLPSLSSEACALATCPSVVANSANAATPHNDDIRPIVSLPLALERNSRPFRTEANVKLRTYAKSVVLCSPRLGSRGSAAMPVRKCTPPQWRDHALPDRARPARLMSARDARGPEDMSGLQYAAV